MTISRRQMLQSGVWGAIAMTLSSSYVILGPNRKGLSQPRPNGGGDRLPAQPRNIQSINVGFYRFKVGTFNCASLSDGVLNAPAKLFAGNASDAQIQAAVREGFQSETLTIDCNILYVDTGKNKVLIDVGSGTLNGPTAGKLLDNMAAAGLKASEVDTIIVSHAHTDHIGGFTKVPVQKFPKARYFVSQPEWQFWMSPNPTFPKMMGGPDMVKGMVAAAKEQLAPLKQRVTQFGMEQEIVPGITAISTPGHTPGHVALRIRSGATSLIHTADAVHIASINLRHPDWKPVFDGDPDQAVTSRQAILAQIERDRTLMFAYHFPFPGLGHLRSRSGGGYDWQPLQWLQEV